MNEYSLKQSLKLLDNVENIDGILRFTNVDDFEEIDHQIFDKILVRLVDNLNAYKNRVAAAGLYD